MRLRSVLVLAPLLLLAVARASLAQTAPAPAPAASGPERIEPVYQLYVDVPPYYFAGRVLGEPATVRVDPRFDAQLSSNKGADILQAMADIAAQPELVKPQVMVALAMRLYDIGHRDDAVFWFDNARGRYVTMDAVLDMRSLQLLKTTAAMEAFTAAATDALDGYALCSVARQLQIEDRAVAWVAAHPYKPLGYAELPALVADRNATLVATVETLRRNARDAHAQLADPKTLANLAARRAASHAHERFCW